MLYEFILQLTRSGRVLNLGLSNRRGVFLDESYWCFYN